MNALPRSCLRALRARASVESGSYKVAANSAVKLLLPPQELAQSRLVYCAAPATGHNQEGHPECNARVPAILKQLQISELTPEKRGKDVRQLVNFPAATKADIAAVHSLSYVEALEKRIGGQKGDGLTFIDTTGPTYATPSTYEEALLAAGGSLALVDSVVVASRMTSEPPVGFALIRPPGHHAVPAGPMGFCVFGNVAVATRYAQRVHGLKRVFIIDFDVHHGNGTHDAFYEDPDVFFLSTHQDGSYPGTGKMRRVGKGSGEGTTLNLPLPGGSGRKAMSRVFEDVIVPSCRRFKPDIILVSAGYDAHFLDPLAGLQFTTATYYELAVDIKRLARDLCRGRCVFFLEGGYNLESLSHSVADTFRALLGERSCAHQLDDSLFLYDEPDVRRCISDVKAIHGLA